MSGDTRMHRAVSAGLTIVLALFLFAAALTASSRSGRATPATTVPPVSAPAGTYFDYVVIILLENHNLCDILTTCGGSATYLSSLANASGLATEDRYCNVNPSLPNYLCLSGGTDFGCSGYDGNPNSNACTNTAWNAPNIVDRLEAGGVTWKAYMEDMPNNCAAGNSGNYLVRHNPFVYYNDISSNASRCARVVPSGTNAGALLSDLGSLSTASNYMWFSPNKCNDMHSCSVAVGDAYLANLVPQILSSSVFTTQRAALLITFDEGYGQPVYTVWAGPAAKTGFSSTKAYSHFSVLATIESNWNLTALTSNDGGASIMGEFFTGITLPTITITSPADSSTSASASVNVTGTASGGGVQKVELSTDGITWTLATGTTSWTGKVTLVAGSNTIIARVTDASGHVQNTRITVTANIPGGPPPPSGPFPLALLLGIPLVIVVAAVAVAVVLWRRKKKREEPPRREDA